MTCDQFKKAGEDLALKFQLGEMHNYFRTHAPRLHHACEFFDLFSGRLGEVLEIGPFYGYTPFFLRPHCTSYTVLEGNDPVVYKLEPVYKEFGVKLSYVDFFEIFGPTQSATHRLAAADSSFDTILCWETMEHFNFNPVKFVRELHRVLKPGGRVFITGPNRASWQAIAGLFSGKSEKPLIDGYYQFENYEMNGKKAFYGFHWREYSFPELLHLFNRAGFQIQRAGSFNSFQPREKMGLPRRLVRSLAKAGASLFPRYGTHVYLVASK